MPNLNKMPLKTCWQIYTPANPAGSITGLELNFDLAMRMVACAVTSECEHRAMCSELALEMPWPMMNEKPL